MFEPELLTRVAVAAHLSVRSLREAFRRHLDATPTGYPSRVRPARAHADLLAASPGRGRVAAVAARWGFVQPGRFAAAYRAAYGCLPHETLREDRG
ncbi:helix-turn-helix domain-containing protein [Streptomyces longispororuber]|uniref:helix-turn-helix domain-containing protein n=1 Tax=Streptomyces longispororuber TaxID=68230 RepID=UPI0033F51E1E